MELRTSVHSYSLDCLCLHIIAVLQSVSLCTYTPVFTGLVDLPVTIFFSSCFTEF